MDKISSISIVHSSTRDYKETLDRCEKTISEHDIVINSIIADCLLKMLSERPDERQYYLVSDILDLVGETVQGEFETAISLMKGFQGKEGYALTTMRESHSMNTNQDIRGSSWKTIRAAEICEKLGTGGQVIFQSEETVSYTHLTLPTKRIE